MGLITCCVSEEEQRYVGLGRGVAQTGWMVRERGCTDRMDVPLENNICYLLYITFSAPHCLLS